MYFIYVYGYSPIILLVFFDLGFCHNKYVENYETLSYRPVVDRHKRSLNGRPSTLVDLHFLSHNRTFHLKLRPLDPHKSLYTNDYVIDVNGEEHPLIDPHNFLYHGYLDGDPSSSVYGTLLDGIFDGYITTGDKQTFTVEKSAKYISLDGRPSRYHSIIYADSEINHPIFRTKRDSNENVPHRCGLTSQMHKEMQKLQEMGVDEMDNAYSSKYSEDINFDYRRDVLQRYLNRTKRSEHKEFKEINGKRIFEVRTCIIYLQADHKIYEHIYNKEGNRDHIRTREEIVALLYTHIKAVNQIYEGTDFNGIRGINFAIQRTTIYTPETCLGDRSATVAINPFCEENVDVSHYLNMNSQKDHSAFCLAYSLTYRDFVGGTLGLAWVASPSQSTAGGICQKYQRYNEHQRGGVNRSLNTGIITLVNYGNRVPPRVSQLTLAHEIGHNFGSPHDFPLECQPGLPDGNFIMFASATSGDKPNNSKFSKCSVANISEVLFEVLSQNPKSPSIGRKKNCFTDQLKSFCGNQIKEDDEQCDCGFNQQDCEEMGDHCCIPRENQNELTWCRRKPGMKCSPSEGLCCNATSCSYYDSGDRRLCREESECQKRQYCNGKQAECPLSENKEEGKPCQDNTKVCNFGSCNGSICSHFLLKDCFLTDGKPEDLCQLACEKGGICLPSTSISELTQLFQEGRRPGHLLLPPGSPCNNYQGYCDIFRKCRSVDSNGPLARLKNLLFNPDTIKEFTQLIKENWWACVAIGIMVILLMALFVKCCAVHTPSTNPNKLPPANFTDTLRHPGTLLRRGHPRTQSTQRVDRTARTANPVTNHTRTNVPPQAPGHPRNQRHAPSRNIQYAINETPLTAIPLIGNSNIATTSQANSHNPIEPPPPYQLTDPAVRPGNPLQPINFPSMIAVAGPSAISALVPSALPAPTSSAVPLIPGPPHGKGPKPGRRKPRPSPQKVQHRKKKGEKADEKESNRRHKRLAK